jgi:hypothetical protein
MQVEEMSYQELLAWSRGCVLIEIGKGRYEHAIRTVVEVAIRWRAAHPIDAVLGVCKCRHCHGDGS